MSTKDWNELVTQSDKRMSDLRKGIPDAAAGFGALAKAAIAEGAIDSKTKELMAIAIGIAARCDGCLVYHTKAAARFGATRQEVLETIAVAVYMGGGPSMIYGSEALAAFDNFSQ